MTSAILRPLALIGAAAFGLTACATTPGVDALRNVARRAAPPAATAASTPPATPAIPASTRIVNAAQLLRQGKPAEARIELVAALKDEPANETALKLLKQIDTDPAVLLGTKSYPYRGKAGDTADGLAERYLGDALMFYAFARYNGVTKPSESLEGRSLRIPGELKAAPAPTRAAAPAPKPAATPSAPSANPARAAELRSAGLVQLNKGAVAQAVGLLQQAARLDPANPAIKRDLDRALRLQRTVRGG